MNQNLSPLIDLQKLDLRIMEIHEQRRKIPERLQAVETPLREAKQRLQDATGSVDALVKDRRSHEKDLEAHEAQTEKMKSHLSQLKTNKEYQAHLFEIEVFNKKKGDIEEKILLAMEKIEELQRAQKTAQDLVKGYEKTFAQEKHVLEEQEHVLATELADLEKQYRERATQVEKGLLERYTKLKNARKDQALAAIREGICSGCRLQIPPQLIAEVKRSQDLHTCPYCHRMLYWDGEISVEQKALQDRDKTSDLEVGESV